jgi:hypothetical protein
MQFARYIKVINKKFPKNLLFEGINFYAENVEKSDYSINGFPYKEQ